MNFLERLVADWYGHQGYLVQLNFKFGERAGGGYEGETDVLAVKLKAGELVHFETSADALSWEKRQKRILRKFKTAEAHYPTAFGMEFKTVRRIAVVGIGKAKKPVTIDGVEVWSVNDLMFQIKQYVKTFSPASRAIPEGYGYLRAVQFAVWFGSD